MSGFREGLYQTVRTSLSTTRSSPSLTRIIWRGLWRWVMFRSMISSGKIISWGLNLKIWGNVCASWRRWACKIKPTRNSQSNKYWTWSRRRGPLKIPYWSSSNSWWRWTVRSWRYRTKWSKLRGSTRKFHSSYSTGHSRCRVTRRRWTRWCTNTSHL